MYRIMGEAGREHIISSMQGDHAAIYIHHSRVCIQKASSQHDRVSDWEEKALLCESNIFNEKIKCNCLFSNKLSAIGIASSNRSIFYTSPVSNLAIYKPIKLCMAPISMSVAK